MAMNQSNCLIKVHNSFYYAGDMVQVLSGLVAMMTAHRGMGGAAFRPTSLQWML